jgi:hypothetical protein
MQKMTGFPLIDVHQHVIPNPAEPTEGTP